MSSQKCCISGCDRPGIVSANHPSASVYCHEHGVCGRCGKSVEFFTFNEQIGVWMCPCRDQDLRPKAAKSEDAEQALQAYWSKQKLPEGIYSPGGWSAQQKAVIRTIVELS